MLLKAVQCAVKVNGSLSYWCDVTVCPCGLCCRFCTMIAMIYVEDLVLMAHNEVEHIIFCLLYVCIKL